jgi:hypothetical protein
VPYSPEYRESGTNRALLNQLARLTGGGELPQPVAAFVHNLPSADRAREIWGTLLLIVALLFPLDVALRRVMLGPRDFAKAVSWLRMRLPLQGTMAGRRERALGRLFQARDRVRQRHTRAETPPPVPSEAPAQSTPVPPETRDAEPAPSPPSSDDALARLRQAKKRARRDR